MSHNTTSWKSHSSTWRWTAGNDGRSPEGGKARQIGGRPALARQKAIRAHDQREMAMQAIPAPALVVVKPAFAFGILIDLLDGPAAVGQLDQPVQRRVRREVTVIPLDLAAFARQRTLAEQPPFRPSGDPMMAGGELRATRGPMRPHGHELFAEDHVVGVGPGAGLPALLREGIEHGLGRIERGGARLLRLAAPPRTRWGQEGCRLDLVWQAHPEGAAHAHDVGDLPVVEALQEGRGVAIASVSDHRGKRDAPCPRLIYEG